MSCVFNLSDISKIYKIDKNSTSISDAKTTKEIKNDSISWNKHKQKIFSPYLTDEEIKQIINS